MSRHDGSLAFPTSSRTSWPVRSSRREALVGPTRWAGIMALALGLAATPAPAQTVSVGVLRGAIPPDTSVGVTRGSLPADATAGTLAGPLPAGGTVGVLQGNLAPGETTRVFAGPLPAGATIGVIQGAVPAGGQTGLLAGSLPPNATFRMRTPEDIARGQEALAERHSIDAVHGDAESLLRRATGIREETLGAQHPGVAESLDNQARMLRRSGRNETAADLEGRARAIRESQTSSSAPSADVLVAPRAVIRGWR